MTVAAMMTACDIVCAAALVVAFCDGSKSTTERHMSQQVGQNAMLNETNARLSHVVCCHQYNLHAQAENLQLYAQHIINVDAGLLSDASRSAEVIDKQ